MPFGSVTTELTLIHSWSRKRPVRNNTEPYGASQINQQKVDIRIEALACGAVFQREEVTTRMLTENRQENYNSISFTAVFMFFLP
jgi:hypothetical protein